MLYTSDNNRDERTLRRSKFHSMLRKYLRSAWNILVSLVINMRDVSSAGRIQL